MNFGEIHVHVLVYTAVITGSGGPKDPGNERIRLPAFQRMSAHPQRLSFKIFTRPRRHNKTDIFRESRGSLDLSCAYTTD